MRELGDWVCLRLRCLVSTVQGVYLGLSETVLILGQGNMIQDHLSGLLSLDRITDQLGAQDFVSVFLLFLCLCRSGGFVKMEREMATGIFKGLAWKCEVVINSKNFVCGFHFSLKCFHWMVVL